MAAVRCIIIDEIHLLNDDRGPIIEAIVARYIRHMEQSQAIGRIVGISATLPNWQDVGAFLRVDPSMIFHFGHEWRPIPLEQTFIGLKEKDRFRALQLRTEICYERVVEFLKEGQQCLVFVHSRADTFATAESFRLMSAKRSQSELFKVKTCASSAVRWRFPPTRPRGRPGTRSPREAARAHRNLPGKKRPRPRRPQNVSWPS
eukprot:GHVT01065486.1.p1 GENE.GHVT01065486.1~~GHVT01065486.1.p1  ORF type:complete len:237 (+),score=55.39 GHVT01065486.1:104-712(+)